MSERRARRVVLCRIVVTLSATLLGARPGAALTPTPTPLATATAACAPTGTPYCADHCEPCPTIRAGCFAFACGACRENPVCAPNQTCEPVSGGQGFGGCCLCATAAIPPTPTATPPPGESQIRGHVYDASRGPAAGIAGARVELHIAGTRPQGTGYTNAAGDFAITLELQDDDWIVIEVTADGYYDGGSERGYTGAELRPGAFFSFGLQPRNDAAIRGRVFDAAQDAHPGIAGAHVGFWQGDSRYDLTTDANGVFTFTLAVPDDALISMSVSADGYLPGYAVYEARDLRLMPMPEIGLQPGPTRVDTEVHGLVYDVSIGTGAPIADAEVDYEYYGGGVFPDTSGTVHTGADGRYRIDLPIGPDDGLRLTAVAAGFGFLWSSTSGADLIAGNAIDFGMPPNGGVVRVEPSLLSFTCPASFDVTVRNAAAAGETLTIVGIEFSFDYGEGVYAQDFTWDLSGIHFPTFLASGESIVFPMAFTGGAPSRVFVNVVSGALEGGGAQYYGVSSQDCGACRGDCNGDLRVTVDELVRAVAMALISDGQLVCPGLDANADATVSIAELITAVDNALNGCGGPAA
jgi:hypothetical protein